MAETADRVVVELLAQTDASDAKIETHRRKFEQAMQSDISNATKMETAVERAANNSGKALVRVGDSAAQAAQRSRLLGFQIADIGSQLSSGTSPFIVLAQQGSQVAMALEGASGIVGRLAAFFTGPWGAAVLAAGTVLGSMLIPRLLNTGEAADDAKAKVEGLNAAIKSMADLGPHVQDMLTKQGQLAQIERQITTLRSQGGRGPALEAMGLQRDANALREEIQTSKNFIELYAQRVRTAAEATAGKSGSLHEGMRKVREETDLAVQSVSAMALELSKLDINALVKSGPMAPVGSYKDATGVDVGDPTRKAVDAIDARKEAEYQANKAISDDYLTKMDTRVRTIADLYENAMTGANGSIGATLKSILIHAIAQSLAQTTVGGSGGGGFFGSIASGLSATFGFAQGGSMMIGGRSGVDRNTLSLNGRPIAKVSRGEGLTVSPAGRAARAGGGTVIQQTFVLDARYGITTTELLDHVNTVASQKAAQAGQVAYQTSQAAVPGRLAKQQVLGT